MDKLEGMKVFVAIVENGTLTEASYRLGKSLPAIARTLKELEAALGMQLLIRTSRRPILTSGGETYYEACKRILNDIANVESEVTTAAQDASGEVTLTAPVVFGKRYVAPSLFRLQQQSPELIFRLSLDNTPVNLTEGGFDLAVRMGELEDSQLRSRRIGEMGVSRCVSPDFLERFGPISEPNDLRKLPSICLDISGRRSGQQWKFADASGEQITVRHTPVLFCNDIECAISACAAGIGVCSFYDYHVSDELRLGALVRVLADYSPPPHPIHLLRPPTVKISASYRQGCFFSGKGTTTDHCIGAGALGIYS